MYIGSNAFQAANERPIQKHRISGTIDNIPFTGRNVLAGSMTISNQCSEESDFKIGAVYIGQLSVTFLRNLSVIPTTWQGRKITVNFGLCVDEIDDIWETFQIGEFYVSEAEINADGITVTAYDVMTRFEKDLPSDFLASGSFGDIAKALCQTCGVTFGMTDQEAAALPNGSQTVGLYTPNDCKTYRDVVFWLSNTIGGFATINRFGNLVFRTYKNRSTALLDIGPSKRVQGARFSDFSTDFESVVFENADGTSERYGNMRSNRGYYVGFNPFVEYGTIDARRQLRGTLADVIEDCEYTPFSVELMSAPIYELGDVLEFTGGIIAGQNKIGIVQSVEWSLNRSLSIKGFGANPALQDVMTSREEADAAGRRSDQNSEMIYRDYTNLVPINITSDPTKVVDIYFTTNKETDVEVWHEIQLETSIPEGTDRMTVQAVYYLDSVEIARKPIETFDDSAFHILDLHYFSHIENVGSHRWEVTLESSGGTAAIRSNDAIAVLKGQGLSKADGWTGIIILEDDITPPFLEMSVPAISDSANVFLIESEMISIVEPITPPTIGMVVPGFTENVSITLYTPTRQIVTENDEYNIVTEDGESNVVTETE